MGLPLRRENLIMRNETAGVRRIIAVAVWCLVIAACTPRENPPPDVPLLGRPFNCDEPIDVLTKLPDSYVIVAGVVALPGASDILQRSPVVLEGDPNFPRAFSKMGLLLRPATTFQISVAPDSRQNALIGWGTNDPEEAVGSIAVGSCSGDTHEWLVYPGGVWTLDPACVELLIVTEQASEIVRLPLDAPCP